MLGMPLPLFLFLIYFSVILTGILVYVKVLSMVVVHCNNELVAALKSWQEAMEPQWPEIPE